MPTLNLLYKKECAVNDKIHIVIPTVGEILDNEDDYYNLLFMLTAMPVDMMVWLDDIGIDFAEINDYQLFLYLFPIISKMDTSLIFNDINLSNFEPAVNKQNEQIVLLDPENDIVIDRAIHSMIADTLRKIHHQKKNRRKPANDEGKDFMLRRARQKMMRRKKKVEISQLESLIVAMVNTEQFKYNYEDTLDLTIYQFNESVQQIVNKVDYEHKMAGVYAGTLDTKHMSQDDFNWLVHK